MNQAERTVTFAGISSRHGTNIMQSLRKVVFRRLGVAFNVRQESAQHLAGKQNHGDRMSPDRLMPIKLALFFLQHCWSFHELLEFSVAQETCSSFTASSFPTTSKFITTVKRENF
ncbi:unnamed protein product [Caenorhabditis auriculariae]|uniref:Uncharacterized protein n=1 Tax=Caenorhabditis auriculariae TaxID=2777116 RepID=A0A8S1HIZ6_9PELO|nr:unnamed protein product [Caenorhabditis auriculariae]